MQIFIDIQNSINKNKERNAFFIDGINYSYDTLATIISAIRIAIVANTDIEEKNIGLIANDDIETYAAIIALWLEGKAYVPLSPETPKDRNENIINQAQIATIINSSPEVLITNCKVIESKKLPSAIINLTPKQSSNQDIAYLLFTSGTTGTPKGVPITRANLSSFAIAFDALGLTITEDDKCLQMFELTFDLSVMSYLIPILKGACVYTIPKDVIKYLYIYQLMEEQQITIALMVPSILQNLRTYFGEIKLAKMKYSLFCGEALPIDVVEEWQHCLPNATILNVYGPTEDTIFCTHYTYKQQKKNKSYNGLLSIGKPMKDTITIIIDDNDELVSFEQTGQLCLGGIQLTPGYWKNEEKNKEAFFIKEHNGAQERFYKTGDLCRMDKSGDILYLGRLDFQIKVQGFRVELSEIEFHVKHFLQKINAVAIANTDNFGNTEVGVAIESTSFDITLLNLYLKTKMPAYMLPKKIIFTPVFPLNTNGKTDRKSLRQLF